MELIQRDRLVILGALSAVVAAAWAWLVIQPYLVGMNDHAGVATIASQPIGALPGHAMRYFADDLFMWFVMMAAMMLPSATPMILALARAVRAHDASADPRLAAALFAGVYLAAWGVFSVAGSALQVLLIENDVIDPVNLGIKDGGLQGLVLAAFGLYQLTPVKRACLAICRSAITFRKHRLPEEQIEPARLGLVYVASCAGASWMYMPLLFVVGVMNPLWVGFLAILILVEKNAPAGPVVGRLIGAASAIGGLAVMVATAFERYP